MQTLIQHLTAKLIALNKVQHLQKCRAVLHQSLKHQMLNVAKQNPSLT